MIISYTNNKDSLFFTTSSWFHGSCLAQGLLASTSQGHLRFSFVGIAPWTGKVSRVEIWQRLTSKGVLFGPWKSEACEKFQLHLHLVRKKVCPQKYILNKSVVRPVVAMLNEFGRKISSILAIWQFHILENLASPCSPERWSFVDSPQKKKFEVPTREKSFQDMAVYWQ